MICVIALSTCSWVLQTVYLLQVLEAKTFTVPTNSQSSGPINTCTGELMSSYDIVYKHPAMIGFKHFHFTGGCATDSSFHKFLVWI